MESNLRYNKWWEHADFVVDLGPGAGLHGGKIVAQGTPEEIEKNTRSLTGKYLSKKLTIPLPDNRRISDKFIHVIGCREHNLKKGTKDVFTFCLEQGYQVPPIVLKLLKTQQTKINMY